MNISGVRDFNSLPFLVIPSTELAGAPEEYILGYGGDQVDTPVKGDNEESHCKVEIKTEDDDDKLLLNCIIEDYATEDNADFLEKDQISKKKKRYHVDDKEIINHLLSESPEVKKEVNDTSLIKKETDDISNKTILVDLVPELPIENSLQGSQKEVSLGTKKKNKKNVSDSQRSPEVIQLDDDSTDNEGTDTVLEPETDLGSDYSPQGFPCTECGLKDKRKHHLKRHQSVARNGFRLACNMCREKTYSQSKYLKHHKQLKHGLVPSSSTAQGHGFPTAVPSAAVPPAVAQPTAVPSAAVPPAVVQAAAVPSAAVPPVVANPAAVPPAVVQAAAVPTAVGQPAAAPLMGLEPVVLSSRNNAKAVETGNSGHGSPMDEPIDCESYVTSNNQTKKKVPVPEPPFVDSYCRMITKAILASPEKCISLKELLSSIPQNYAFYSKEPDGWQAHIEKYLCRSNHFVKVLPKNLAEGSPEMWILNPATERKMITRYVRGSSRQKQVNQPGLGSHLGSQRVKSNLEQLPVLTNSSETIRQDKIANPNERSVNKKQNNLSCAKFKDSSTPNNSYAVNGIQIQKVTTQNKHVSAPSFRKSISLMSKKQMPSSKCNKPVKSYSALKSLFNLVNQKIAEHDSTEMKKDERLSTVKKTSLVNSNRRGSTNLSSNNTSSNLLRTTLTETDKQKDVENVPEHMLLECIEVCDLSSGDEDERPTIRSSCLETVTSNSNQCNAVSGNGIFKASTRSLNRHKPNKTFGQGNSCSGETSDTCSNSSTTSKVKQTNTLNVPERSVEVYNISSEDECIVSGL